jgi:hypothetical protein
VTDLPVIAEVYSNGNIHLATVIELLRMEDSTCTKPPKVAVEYFHQMKDTNKKEDPTSTSTTKPTEIVDFQQIATIWGVGNDFLLQEHEQVIQATYEKLQKQPKRIETVLERLYRSRRPTKARNKKNDVVASQLQTTIQEKHSGNLDSPDIDYDTVARQMNKAGGRNCFKIVDSQTLAPLLFEDSNHTKSTTTMIHRGIAALVLGNDAQTRFKRWPCVYVGCTSSSSIAFVNGGWIVVDQNVRAIAEAQRFVQRSSSPNLLQHKDDEKKLMKSGSTNADDRIIRRLECLAMGATLTAEEENNKYQANIDDNENNRRIARLEVDVRETLKAMGLPLTPEGAKKALVRIGRWSGDEKKQEAFMQKIQPWSKPILEAATWYAESIATKDDPGTRRTQQFLDGRLDLTRLPCVSIDAQRATFRDDAIGLRHRSETGRKIIPGASKWEILIHVADVSDIYTILDLPRPHEADAISQGNRHVLTLREAAASRGMSRYDLPLGPLHLLPPVALRALAFSESGGSNRCVTLWAYFDERDGRVLDAGIERTLISPPTKLTFGDATALMEKNSNSNVDERVRALLLVVERHLKKWNSHRLQNDAARKRESRLSAREKESKNLDFQFDDGRDGFQRTRGHRLVDIALDLYSNECYQLMKKAKAPLPRAIGADVTRGGRIATAPLRRYIDGQTQRQLLAVLCGFGHPMDLQECKAISMAGNEARNAISNVRAVR